MSLTHYCFPITFQNDALDQIYHNYSIGILTKNYKNILKIPNIIFFNVLTEKLIILKKTKMISI